MKQREIKFRVWNKVMEEMFYPDWDELAMRAKLVEMVLMQYTGLKDKNGKELYEGDIVQGYRSGQKFKNDIYFISYDENSFIMASRKNEKRMDCIWIYDFEIIGNIYKNPKLIKLGK